MPVDGRTNEGKLQPYAANDQAAAKPAAGPSPPVPRCSSTVSQLPCRFLLFLRELTTPSSPSIREALMRRYRDWMSHTSKALSAASVNWSQGIDAAVQRDPETGRIRITPEFERHVKDAANWVFKQSALEVFPELTELGAMVSGVNTTEDPWESEEQNEQNEVDSLRSYASLGQDPGPSLTSGEK